MNNFHFVAVSSRWELRRKVVMHTGICCLNAAVRVQPEEHDDLAREDY